MPHFKDATNQVHWLDDAKYAYMLPAGSVQITDVQADALRAPPAPSAEALREAAKKVRAAKVEAITVTTKAGNTFDGDETSQGRMARAILAMQASATPTTSWVLASNIKAAVTVAELTEALALAGAAQTALWTLV